MNNGQTLVIVPCGQRKIWDINPSAGAAKAKDAYAGPLFKVNREYAELFADEWVILSAKYGLVSPDFVIPAAYNVTFKKPATVPVSVTVLKDQVGSLSLGRFSRVIALGGKEYRFMVEQAFKGQDVELVFPFSGLPIGKMMQATKRAIESNQPVPGE